MKKLTYHCPECKKDITVLTDKQVIPASNLHIECKCQVWLRSIEDVKEETNKS